MSGDEDFLTSVNQGPLSLKSFADQRRAYLLAYPAIKELAPAAAPSGR